MITPEYVRTMTVYNAQMNRRLYAAASRLADLDRRRDRGAFWGSIHGTFCHLLWGDLVWMERLAGWQGPSVPLAQSAGLIASFSELHAAREHTDVALIDWAVHIDVAWLAEDQTWFSGATRSEANRPRSLVLMHFFNHQTHHRGQAHAMLTAAG